MSTGLILATCLAVIVAAVVVAVWLRERSRRRKALAMATVEANARAVRAYLAHVEARLSADQPASDHGDETAARPGDEGR